MTNCPCARRFPDGLERVAGDPTFYCGPRRVGNHILLYGKKEGRFPHHCMVGPNWPCMLLTYGMILVTTLALLIFKTGADHWVASLIASFTGGTLLLAFSLTACSDPGIVYRSVEGFPPDREAALRGDGAAATNMGTGGVLCGRCDVKRPLGGIHCSECDVCVSQFDHHCPWTGKCIGEKNIIFFYFFLCSLIVHIVVVGIMVLSPSVTESL